MNFKTFFIFLMFFLLVFFINIPKEHENFIDANTPNHQLFNMQAWDATKISEHKFLPLLSWGLKEDKGFKNLSSVIGCDKNSYYISFPALGFIAPYIFMKFFNLEINRLNLYIFNMIILFLSSLLFAKILNDELKKQNFKKESNFIFISLAYLLQVETIHSSGIVYWGHSLFQLTFLIQVFLFIHINKTFSKNLFFIFAFINPLIEWTGYVSNFGFMIVFYMQNKNYKNILLLILTSTLSFLIFILHISSNIDLSALLNHLKTRLTTRKTPANEIFLNIFLLFKGYFVSYRFLIIFILSLIIVCKKYGYFLGNEIKKFKYLLIIFSIPIFENFILSNHAIIYTFDRLKVCFLLIIFLIILLNLISLKITSKHYLYLLTFIITIFFITSIYYEKQNRFYFKDDMTNKKIANYINENYPRNERIIFSPFLRSYENLLFKSAVISKNNLTKDFLKNNKRKYYICLNTKLTNFKNTPYLIANKVKEGFILSKFCGFSIIDDKNKEIKYYKNSKQDIILYKTSVLNDENLKKLSRFDTKCE